jgi:DNA uptake protein ComE-like DNA-binding protein
MKYGFHSVVLVAGMLLLGTGVSSASENKTEASQPTVNTDVSPQNAGQENGAKHKHRAKTKLVDINSATKEQLMSLPGINAADADKIVAGRPFGSKAWLVTNEVISFGTYQAVKGRIICQLTKKDAEIIQTQAKHKNKQSNP